MEDDPIKIAKPTGVYAILEKKGAREENLSLPALAWLHALGCFF